MSYDFTRQLESMTRSNMWPKILTKMHTCLQQMWLSARHTGKPHLSPPSPRQLHYFPWKSPTIVSIIIVIIIITIIIYRYHYHYNRFSGCVHTWAQKVFSKFFLLVGQKPFRSFWILSRKIDQYVHFNTSPIATYIAQILLRNLSSFFLCRRS